MPRMKGYHALKNLPEEKITDTITRRILVGDKEMIVWWSMKAGVHAAAHQHPTSSSSGWSRGRWSSVSATRSACAGRVISA